MCLPKCIVLIFTVMGAVCGNRRLLDNDVDTINSRLIFLEKKIQTLEAQVQAQNQETTSRINNLEKAGKGATYIRWGRQTCSTNGTELVYAGIAGGGHYLHTGAPSDFLCLPHDPNLFNAVSTNPYGDISIIYGAEYEDNIFGSNVYDRDVPCAVCHVKQASSILMIPGRNHCHSGWSLEYHGKLAAGADPHNAASEYACVDNAPEVFERSDANLDGKLFYSVKAACGSLPCPPYVNGQFLTCVVCSK